MPRPAEHLWLFAALAFFALHAAIIPRLYSHPRLPDSAEMEVAIPRFAQVLMTAGDRFLAADIAGFRALVASTEKMDRENYRILGIVQSDVSWLNPAHEDNYYIAAAILPWNGELDAAQRILKAASEARPFDWQPAFFYAFNTLHFQKDYESGANWLRIAASHTTDERERIQLQDLATAWAAKAPDQNFAIRLSREMARETRHSGFARFLEKRAVRLENLQKLENAIEIYTKSHGSAPTHLVQLIKAGILPTLPVDPFGLPYGLDQMGKPRIENPTPRKNGVSQ